MGGNRYNQWLERTPKDFLAPRTGQPTNSGGDLCVNRPISENSGASGKWPEMSMPSAFETRGGVLPPAIYKANSTHTGTPTPNSSWLRGIRDGVRRCHPSPRPGPTSLPMAVVSDPAIPVILDSRGRRAGRPHRPENRCREAGSPRSVCSRRPFALLRPVCYFMAQLQTPSTSHQ